MKFITGGLSWYDVFMAIGLAFTVIRVVHGWIIERLHSRQIKSLQHMHSGTVASHPPEPSPGETSHETLPI